MAGRSPLILVGLALACAGGASAQGVATPKGQVVSGVVRLTGGDSVAGADVRLLVANQAVAYRRTGADGRFSFAADLASPTVLEVRRLGYRPQAVVLHASSDSLQLIVVVLAPVVQTLEAVDVVADRVADEGVGSWLDAFNMRRETNSFGRYFTGAMVRSAAVYQPSEMLRMIPGVRLSATAGGGNAVRMRGCRQAPLVWIDGTRVPGAELDEVTRPGDIAGMEVYTSTAGLPAQFMDRTHSPCGTIVIWTRHR